MGTPSGRDGTRLEHRRGAVDAVLRDAADGGRAGM
ncbi:hypothetical protein ACUXMN_001927 [Micrococcus yunnanensis]|uniref:TetR/AcrR family transcriptional regulator n=2 Tax=Micrococcus TaxID=1269 RepID=A0ABR6CXR0_9MICC|nr:hypothetical protein [Micrococcus yunnanensis]MBA9080493.1 hypothetical protein [Micrococcus aloeverae]